MVTLFVYNQWGSPIPFPTGGACVLSVIRFQDGGRRSAGGSVPKLEYDTYVPTLERLKAVGGTQKQGRKIVYSAAF